jgi:putative oxidoreductase
MTMADLLAALGRILLPIVFLVDGYAKFANIDRTANFIGARIPPLPQLEQMLGMTSPTIYAYGAAAGEVVGPVLLIVGFFTRTAAVALFIFTAVTIYFFHSFWAIEGAQAAIQQIQALKNLAIMGGLLVLAAHGPGRYSIDGRQRTATSRPVGT